MGTWGSGPFDNDAAADFLDQLRARPARVVVKALREVVNHPVGKYIDADAGGAAWAACELVALAFGHGDTAGFDDRVLDGAGRLGPREEHRRLALEVLSRIADPAVSELSALRHDGNEGPHLEASLAHLRSRLEAASAGPRELPKAKTGDVICFPATPDLPGFVVVQVVGSGELAVFEGACLDDSRALNVVKSQPARRVPAAVNQLLRRGRILANMPVRKDLKGKKLYAGEIGVITDYVLGTASAGRARLVSYDEACDCDLLRPHDEEAIRAVAFGTSPRQRVRSPEQREAEFAARNADSWAARREATRPGPFGDVEALERLVTWMDDYGTENAVLRFCDEAVGVMGYGRPNEKPERHSFAFAGIVAVWRKTWSQDLWPTALKGRLPAAPKVELMDQAMSAARTLASRVLTRDSELRMIWEGGPDRGAGLHAAVVSLQKALS